MLKREAAEMIADGFNIQLQQNEKQK